MNREIDQTRKARANSVRHSEDWGLQFWEECLEVEEAKKLVWNHTDGKSKLVVAVANQIEQMFGGKNE